MPTSWYNTDLSPLWFIVACLILAPSLYWIFSEWAKDGRE